MNFCQNIEWNSSLKTVYKNVKVCLEIILYG